MAIDRIPLPPAVEEFASPAGNFVFVVSTPDNWKSRKAVGELFDLSAGQRRPLWKRTLPHEFGPRYVLVGNDGDVLLLDEWINVKSRYAVMVLSPENRVIAQHDFDAVQTVLNVPGAQIVRTARHGLWITSPPTLDTSGEWARVETAGKVLTIRLSDGHLSLAP